jgi:hypothetical protein
MSQNRRQIVAMAMVLALAGVALTTMVTAAAPQPWQDEKSVVVRKIPSHRAFQLDVMVEGRPLPEYPARGREYIEALEGAEYDLRLTNPYPERVAVALSVDGLNTIDARHTSAWNSSKWVIQPYETITITGWQMSSERARRFYFTNERDSYGAKLGQTANLGVISAVFFRERLPAVLIDPPRPIPRDRDERRGQSSESQSPGDQAAGARQKSQTAVSPRDDDYAATGIGRSVWNSVRWVNMDLEPNPVGEVTIRYEYYSTLLRLGVIPRRYGDPDRLRQRDQSKGFSDRRFSPEP